MCRKEEILEALLGRAGLWWHHCHQHQEKLPHREPGVDSTSWESQALVLRMLGHLKTKLLQLEQYHFDQLKPRAQVRWQKQLTL